jgi:hypothetical protein
MMNKNPEVTDTAELPNVVVVLMDTARADRLSCYGNKRETTPFLDSLAEDGTRYEEAYSTSIWSLPAYTSLFTGELPSAHGVTSWVPTARNDLVPALHSDYQSICVSPHVMGGGWGLVDEFDRHERVKVPHKAPLISPDPILEEMRGQEFSIAEILRLLRKHRTARTLPNGLNQLFKKKIRYKYGFWDDSGAESTVARSKEAASETDEPFFMFMNFVESHMPIHLPRQWARRYTDQSVTDINNLNNIDLFDATFKGREITDSEKQLFEDLHDSSLAYLDSKIEEFHEHLVDQGVADDTVYVFLSDHGNLFGERGIWGHHADIHRNVCRVPLIIRYPWETEDVIEEPVSITSLFDNIVKISMGKKDEISPEGDVFVEYSGYDEETLLENGVPLDPWSYYQVSCISGEWKLDWRADGGVRLHGIEDTGPDRAADNPEVVAEMKGSIQREVGEPAELHQRLGSGTDLEDIEDSTVEHLKSLGYLVGEDV